MYQKPPTVFMSFIYKMILLLCGGSRKVILPFLEGGGWLVDNLAFNEY